LASIERVLRRRAARLARLLPVALLLAACAGTPDGQRLDAGPPALLVAAGDAGVRDLRGPYRAAVCRRLAAEERPCGDVLRTLSGEMSEASLSRSVPLADLARRYRIAFVPGFLSECFDGYARPFADVTRSLRGAGFDVDYFAVFGRGSVSMNAARLAQHFRATGADDRPLIVFAYSKGLLDVLEFAASEPSAARRIAAIVAVAGAANGSPLADTLLPVYRNWVAAFPLPGCASGTGDEIHDLRRDVRLEWWSKHGRAVTIPVFSLVAAPEPERVSPGTRATYRALARIDPRNDGKLLWVDQIAPRSFLLGYANADHWAIAIPVAEELPALGFLFRDGVARAVLVEAAIEIVVQVLEAGDDRASK
jgi:hypothetical protein